MIGKLTEYNTLVTEKLIERTSERIDELKNKEKMWINTLEKLTN